MKFKKFPSQWDFADNPSCIETWRRDTKKKLEEMRDKPEEYTMMSLGDLVEELLEALK